MNRGWQEAQQVGGDEAFLGKLLRAKLARAAMQPDCGPHRGVDLVRELGNHTGDHAGQDVARAASSHRGRSGKVDEHLTVRPGDERAVSLENQAHVAFLSESSGGLQAVANWMPKKPGHLARMWRQ